MMLIHNTRTLYGDTGCFINNGSVNMLPNLHAHGNAAGTKHAGSQ